MKLSFTYRGSAGSVTLLVLVMLLFFVIVFGATLRFIARQSNLTVNQEQEEQAFGLADAGVLYTIWLLDETGGNLDLTELEAMEPIVPAVPATDANGVLIGSFSVTYDSQSSDNVRLRSKGFDANRPDICQVIDAELTNFVDSSWRTTRWNHYVSRACNDLGDI